MRHLMAAQLTIVLSEESSLAFDLYRVVSEIVDDFEDWGPVLQANLDGDYDETTAIMRLAQLRNEIRSKLNSPRGE